MSFLKRFITCCGIFLPSIICVLGVVVFSCVAIMNYRHFGFGSWDLALHTQLMWSLSKGTIYVGLYGTNFLADHANLIAFFLIPVFWIFSSALTLMLLKIAVFFLGAYVFYLYLCRKIVNQFIRIAFLLIYIFYPANMFMLLFPFNFENLAPLFIFLMFLYWDKERFLPFFVSAMMLCLIKENMPLLVMMFGFLGLFKKEKRVLWVLAPSLLGALFFIYDVAFLIPVARAGLVQVTNAHWGSYAHLGKTPHEVLMALFDPQQLNQHVFTAKNFKFIIDLFGPFLFFVVAGAQYLILMAPVFLQNILSNYFGQHSIHYYYAATMVPFIFVAVVHSADFLKGRWRTIVLLLAVMLGAAHCIKYIPDWNKKIIYKSNRLDYARWEMINQIPKDASASSAFRLNPPLAARERFYVIGRRMNRFTGEFPYPIPDNVEYALLDFAERRLSASLKASYVLGGQWKVKDAIEDIVLLYKSDYGQGLVNFIDSPSTVPLLEYDKNLTLIDIKRPQQVGSQRLIFKVDFVWKQIVPGYVMELNLKKDGKLIYLNKRDIFYGIDTRSLKPIQDKAALETYSYWFNNVPPGEYEVNLRIKHPGRRSKDLRLGVLTISS